MSKAICSHGLCTVLFISAGHAPNAGAAGMGFEGLFNLDLNTLTNTIVTSVSNTDETLRDAPSTTIVISQSQLVARGYRNLSQIFDDLPGMDVIRPYGDVYFANYWRGIRNNLGSPFLLLMDGVVQNDLYYNSAEIIASLPMTAVDRIEIVYGPASVVYGANAFAGVVNVITRHVAPETGVHSVGEVRAGSFGTRIADVFSSYSGDSGFASVSARYDYGRMDDRYTNDYEWTRDRYYGDPALWGGFAHHSDYGQYNSAHRNTAFDLRAGRGGTMITVQHFVLNSGYGSEYPADIAQNHAWWKEESQAIHITHKHTFSDRVSTKTLLGYRASNLGEPSDFLAGDNVDTDAGVQRQLSYSLWDIDNHSTLFTQDLEWEISNRWHLNGGVKAEWKDLQKAARVNYGPLVAPADAQPDTYAYPEYPNSHETLPGNQVNTSEKGIYGLATWRLPIQFFENDNHLLNAGVRVDDHSVFGSETSFRGGWVNHFGDLTLKWMAIGESYQTPTPRTLYSGWAGSGSDPNLQPETAKTTEFSAEYRQALYQVLLSAYQMNLNNTIINFPQGAANAGESRINGVDLHFNTRITMMSGEWLRFWSYYSFLSVEELAGNATGDFYDPFADTSQHKLHLGLTWPFADQWQAALRSRYYSERETISSNPVDRVKPYATVDINLVYKMAPKDPFQWGLSVENLFDRRYFHPGVRQADAGIKPGEFDENGVWQGSEGYFSSLLPQEGRGIFLSMLWEQ